MFSWFVLGRLMTSNLCKRTNLPLLCPCYHLFRKLVFLEGLLPPFPPSQSKGILPLCDLLNVTPVTVSGPVLVGTKTTTVYKLPHHIPFSVLKWLLSHLCCSCGNRGKSTVMLVMVQPVLLVQWQHERIASQSHTLANLCCVVPSVSGPC